MACFSKLAGQPGLRHLPRRHGPQAALLRLNRVVLHCDKLARAWTKKAKSSPATSHDMNVLQRLSRPDPWVVSLKAAPSALLDYSEPFPYST